MSYYIQCGKVGDDNRLDYNYMGSAEFEWGSVQMSRQLLRFGKTRSKILDEVFYKDPSDQSQGVEKLVMIAIDRDTPHGNLFNRAIADFHFSVRKAYDKGTGYRFKEPPRLEYSVGVLGSAEYKPKTESRLSRYNDMSFWISVDYGVHHRGFTNGHDEEEAKRNLEKYYEAVDKNEDERPVWVVCRLKDFKAVVESMSFPKLVAPGLEAVPEGTIRLFDTVKYRTTDGELTAKVVGILEKGIRLERNEKRFVVDESCIVKIVKEKERT
jgi:hypothetical protein